MKQQIIKPFLFFVVIIWNPSYSTFVEFPVAGHCDLSVTVPSTCNIHLTRHHSKSGEAGCVNTHSAGDIFFGLPLSTQTGDNLTLTKAM